MKERKLLPDITKKQAWSILAFLLCAGVVVACVLLFGAEKPLPPPAQEQEKLVL